MRQSGQSLLLVGHAVEVLRQHDVFKRSEVGNQVELLEDETDFFRASAIQFLGRNFGNVFTVQPYLTGGGAVEAANQIRQGRFPRARRAHDGKPLAGFNLREMSSSARTTPPPSAWAG